MGGARSNMTTYFFIYYFFIFLIYFFIYPSYFFILHHISFIFLHFSILNKRERAQNSSKSIFPRWDIFPENSHALTVGKFLTTLPFLGRGGLVNFQMTPGIKILGVGSTKDMNMSKPALLPEILCDTDSRKGR